MTRKGLTRVWFFENKVESLRKDAWQPTIQNQSEVYGLQT
ncbi:MAG: hypothetical protein ACI835_003050 [Planctomycetota bacterium]|jgi:hypothetical protein